MKTSRDTRIINVPTALSERVAYSWRGKEEGREEWGEKNGERGKEEEEEKEGRINTHVRNNPLSLLCAPHNWEKDVDHL